MWARERKGQKKKKKRAAVKDNGLDRDGKDERQTLDMKGAGWKERRWLAHADYSKYQNQDAVLIWKNWVPGIWEDKSMISFHFAKKNKQIKKHTHLNQSSCLPPLLSLSLFLSLISKWLWLYWIEQWLCIDLVSPLRTNVISALCLCDSEAGARLVVRQVGE